MRLSEALTQPFQAPASIRKFSSSQVYLFRSRPSDSDDSSSEEELDVMELRARGKVQRRLNAATGKVGDVVLLEHQVSKDDNLNKLALQYGCKVADIKRVNNFIQEQDLYALKSIRIPVKVNGILTETQEELLSAQRAGLLLTAELSGSKEEDGSSKDTKQIDQYFRGIDQDIEKATLLVVPPNTDSCIETPNWSPSVRKEAGAGADCGIQWWNAVFIILLVGIILPLFYIVYFKTQHLEVTTTTNTTLPVNNTDGSVRGTPVLRVLKEPMPTIQTHKGGDFLPSGG